MPIVYLIVILAAIFIGIILGLLVVWLDKPVHKRVTKKQLMTANEKEFFRRIVQGCPDYWVFSQVAMGAILKENNDVSPEDMWKVRGAFDKKICDFILCDKASLEPRVIIELDDATHVRTKDAQRDLLTKAGGLPTLRYESKRKPSFIQIGQDVAKALSRAAKI